MNRLTAQHLAQPQLDESGMLLPLKADISTGSRAGLRHAAFLVQQSEDAHCLGLDKVDDALARGCGASFSSSWRVAGPDEIL